MSQPAPLASSRSATHSLHPPLQHSGGYDAALDPWLQRLWPALRRAFPLPPGTPEVGRALRCSLRDAQFLLRCHTLQLAATAHGALCTQGHLLFGILFAMM